MEKILIALGGNALLQAHDKGTSQEQIDHVKKTTRYFLHLLEEGYKLVITHGNGPQVGAILLKNEMCRDKLSPMPLDICVAQTQGQIGYMIQKELYNHLEKAKKNIPVACILSQVLVNKNDDAFTHPTKPIGLFYSEKEAEKLRRQNNWTMVYQQNKGYRRVVPSPDPIDIIEGEEIKTLIDNEIIVIACGGGGIPVVRKEDDSIEGIEAVIDKDKTAAVLAEKIGIHILLILTDVDSVFINYGKPSQKALNKITVEEVKRHIKEDQFAKGSMLPKIEAAIHFLEHGGKRVIITSLEKCKDAMMGNGGTTIVL